MSSRGWWCLLVLSACGSMPNGTDAGAGGGGSSAAGGGSATGGGGSTGGGSVNGGGAATGGGASCSNPGVVTTATPPTVSTSASDFNVTLLSCTRTAVQLACELNTSHRYTETVAASTRSISANGIPNHDVGAFPNPGNPNTISAQNYAYRVPVTPSGNGATSTLFGIALSGAVFDPGTAEVWNNDTTWRYEALRYQTAPGYFGGDSTQHPSALGVDCNFAHVQPTGAYHYHGMPTALLPASPALTHVGWAGDGAPIFAKWGHSNPTDTTSALVELRASYRLKSGTRPANSPGGAYDGTFGNDWEYVAGLGDLDECNGRVGVVTVDGVASSRYHYVLTNTFPYIPRCWHSAPDSTFAAMQMSTDGGMGPPTCAPGQTSMCCGDGQCGGPETHANCAADCP